MSTNTPCITGFTPCQSLGHIRGARVVQLDTDGTLKVHVLPLRADVVQRIQIASEDAVESKRLNPRELSLFVAAGILRAAVIGLSVQTTDESGNPVTTYYAPTLDRTMQSDLILFGLDAMPVYLDTVAPLFLDEIEMKQVLDVAMSGILKQAESLKNA